MHLVEFPHPLALWDTPVTVLIITANHYYYRSDQKKKKKAVRIKPLLSWLLSCRGDETACPRGSINVGAQFITAVIFKLGHRGPQ